jgi:hypothetical protein
MDAMDGLVHFKDFENSVEGLKRNLSPDNAKSIELFRDYINMNYQKIEYSTKKLESALNDFEKRVKSVDLSSLKVEDKHISNLNKVREQLSGISYPDLILIKLKNSIENYNRVQEKNMKEIGSTFLKSNGKIAESIKLVTEAISFRLENKKPEAKINISKISSDESIRKLLSDVNVGGLSVLNLIDILNNNGFHNIKINESIAEKLTSKNPIKNIEGINESLGKKIIDPEKDLTDLINITSRLFSGNYPISPHKIESDEGRYRYNLNKSPSIIIGNLQFYTISADLIYSPLNGVEGILSFSGSMLRYGIPIEKKLSKNTSIATSLNIGMGFLRGRCDVHIGDYTKNIAEKNLIIPLTNANIGVNHIINSNAKVTFGFEVLPGGEAKLEGNRMQVYPKVQNRFYVQYSIGIQ